jgi:hypothetical protein
MIRLPCVLGLAFALLALPVNVTAARWRWSNPLPHGNNVNDFAYRTNRGYVQVCDQGQVYTSTDSLAWTRHDLGFREQLRAGLFFGDRFVATGESGRVLWSDDLVAFKTLNLGTPNWLEGLAASSTRLVAVGDHAALYVSDTGTNWTLQPLPAAQQAWFRGAAWGGTAPGLFVVVGENSTILTSADGLTWTKRAVSSGNGAHLNRVIWAGGGFVAVGDSGTVVFGNAAGTSWVRQQASGASGDLNAAAAASNAARLVVGDQEARLAVLLANSVVWISQNSASFSAPVPTANFLSAVWDGEYFLLGGRSGLLVYGQPTGIPGIVSWTPYTSPSRNWLFDLTTATALGTNLSVTATGSSLLYTTNRTTNTFYVAAGDRATLLNSDEGVTWSSSLAPASATNQTYFGVGGNDRGLVAVGSAGTLSFSPVAYSSLLSTNRFTNGIASTEVVLTNWFNTLGLAWYAATAGTTNDLQAVAASGSCYVIGGANGFLATSENGTDWTPQTSGTTRYLSGLETYADGFVVVGDAGTILTSPEGITWTPRPSGTSNWLYRVRSANGQLVAVGQNGTIATSTNATTWTLANTGVTNWLNDVDFIGGQWFAVGNQGTLLTSPDGSTWTPDPTLLTGKSLYTLATLRGQLVTAGVEGVILRAQIAPFPTPVRVANYPKSAAESLFLLLGSPDQTFDLERATDLLSWQPEAALEITDPSGALLYLSPQTNDVDRQWFRAVETTP